MGKRSDYVRRDRDAYFTPIKAVEPLIDHLPYGIFTYAETCAGDGRLVSHLSELTGGMAHCIFMSDIEPQVEGIYQADAFDITFEKGSIDYIITNPPWDRKFLHPFIWHSMVIAPTWLLFDSDWAFTKQSSTLMTYCKKIVAVGRVKWVEGSKSTGKDNASWYLFDGNSSDNEPTKFFGRV